MTLPAQPALILAGAGSGKTRVLTTRIAWLLHTGQVSPGGVLAVTFTNKAAKEMLARLQNMLPVNVRGMWIGTFHGLCNRFLRAHWKLAALPQSFQILDMQDSQSAIKRIIKAMNLDEERFVAKQVSWFISGSKDDGRRPRTWRVRDEHTRKLVEIYQAYEDQCQREGVVDFAELMLRTYELLRDNDPLREHYQRRFRHVLVDEFQDTNRLQYAWLKMFAPPGRVDHGEAQGVFAVGDDDQSIYAFRGAKVGNMADFEREYRVRKIIKLEQNYRSFGNILDSANALIAHNAQRLGKNLRTEAGPGEPVRVFESTSDFAEAQWLLEEVQALHRGGLRAQRDRAAVPQQRAEPRAGKRAVQCRHAVPCVWRPALLRARRGQARAGLPAADREPERRHQLPARGEFPDARHRRAHASSCCRTRRAPAAAASARAWRQSRARAAAIWRPSSRWWMRCARPRAG